MKKALAIIFIIFITTIAFYFEIISPDIKIKEPTTVYKVYLDGNLMGSIKSKEKLEKYIDNQNNEYKEKYKTDKIYTPNGLDIKADVAYVSETEDVKNIYEKILKEKPFTVKGYQYTITSSYEKDEYEETEQESTENEEIEQKDEKIKIFVLDKSIFENSIDTFITKYTGEEAYKAYKTKTQQKISATGEIIENVYIKNNITVKEINIPVTEKIYTSEKDLSKFLLFGTVEEQKNYTVLDGDTIESIAFNNKISTEEFLLSNPNFTSSKSLLFPGQIITIGLTNPQIQIVVKKYLVEDIESGYTTEIVYDTSKIKGYTSVQREGESGLNRITKETEITNGVITNAITKNIEELKPAISKIVVYGDKIVPNVGTGNWLWPTNKGYTISSYYGYRIDPINGSRDLHTGVDISGTGYGSNIYAADNGVVILSEMHGSNGNYIIVNHNNGYYTSYSHMSKLIAKVGDTVAQGQVIGLVGSTGRSTGNHLHLELWIGGEPYRGGTRLNPCSLSAYKQFCY